MMSNWGFNVVSLAALALALAAMLAALWRARRAPRVENREQALERRVQDLESTVATLQRILLDKQREIETLEERLRQLERQDPAAAAPAPAPRAVLLAALGDESTGMQEDLAALRRVQAQTHLRLTRLLPATRAGLERTLERHRRQGAPVRYLHLATHSGPEGLALGDGVATGLWLSERLAGVEVAVLAGCSGDEVADLLGVVPWVVSLREAVEHRDAAIFSEAFWLGIGEGLTVVEAFERAVRRAPPAVGEFVELHG